MYAAAWQTVFNHFSIILEFERNKPYAQMQYVIITDATYACVRWLSGGRAPTKIIPQIRDLGPSTELKKQKERDFGPINREMFASACLGTSAPSLCACVVEDGKPQDGHRSLRNCSTTAQTCLPTLHSTPVHTHAAPSRFIYGPAPSQHVGASLHARTTRLHVL